MREWLSASRSGPIHDGTRYATGPDDGTWTGTFEGTAAEAFSAEIRADGSSFGHPAPQRDPDQPVTGRWMIISGTDELANLHGQGTCTYEGAEPTDHASYSGFIKFLVPPA